MNMKNVEKAVHQYQTAIAITEAADAISECARIRELTVLLMEYLLKGGSSQEAFKNAERIFEHADKSMRLASAALHRLADIAGIQQDDTENPFFVGEGGKA